MRCACMAGLAAVALAAGRAEAGELSVAFWNIENFFDEHEDKTYPNGTVLEPDKVRLKLRNRGRVLKDLNADIVGLGEVEHRDILRRLAQEELKDLGYEYYVLLDERDERGIDVALMAKRPFLAQSFRVPGFVRGILACRFVAGGQPFYVIMNHWKSRVGGGEDLRAACSKRLREIVLEEIPAYEGRPVPVIVGGDLNDDDGDESVAALEQAGMTNALKRLPKEKRWSLAYDNRKEKKVVYNGFDHCFLNAAMAGGGPVGYVADSAEVVRLPYLVRKRPLYGEQHDWPAEDFTKFAGAGKPREEIIGYSDHFPVRAKLRIPDGGTVRPAPKALPKATPRPAR